MPAQLQAQLVSRLASFDRNFANRAGPVAHVLIVYRANDTESQVEATSIARALEELRQVGGIPARIELADFSDPAALVARCRAQRVALAYFATGLEPEMPRLAAAFEGVDILTVGASASHALSGAVVGFGLEEARPKIVANTKRARVQNVLFKAELLKLARIVE